MAVRRSQPGQGQQLADGRSPRFGFGLVADRDIVPGLWDVLEYITDEVAALEKATG